MAHPSLHFETLRGEALLPHLEALARLRITVFRDWPYLYEGDAAYEAAYLRAHAGSPGAATILCLDGDMPVGAATCGPMAETHGNVRQSFLEAGLDPARFCYFGESILLQPYRGRGAGVRFFELREAQARSLGLDATTFCGVARNVDDLRRPATYRPLDLFWRHRGYSPAGLACEMSWPEPGAKEQVRHRLDFWWKSLSGAPLP